MQVFKENGLPVKFWIREDKLLQGELAGNLETKIRAHGGQVVADREGANIWIIGPSAFETYKESSKNDHRHRVEGSRFVQDCIKAKKLLKEPVPPKRPMRGRPPGKKIEYTPEEDRLLQRWLAMKTPDGPPSGGRMGKTIYERLVAAAHDPNTPQWALLARRNRTWQGLKQRYKVHQAEFDEKIQRIVDEEQLKSDSRYAYEHDRRVNRRPRLLRRESVGEGDDGQPEADGDGDEEGEQVQSDEDELALDDGTELYVFDTDEEEPDPGNKGEFCASSGDGEGGLRSPKRRRVVRGYHSSPPEAGPSRVATRAAETQAGAPFARPGPSNVPRMTNQLAHAASASSAASISKTHFVDLTVDSDDD